MFTDMVYIRYNEDGTLKNIEVLPRREESICVVRCVNCLWQDTMECPMYEVLMKELTDMDYCSFGVRRQKRRKKLCM